MLRRFAFPLFFALLSFAPAARAWDDTVHMIIAQLAWRQMTPEQRRKVTEVLKAHPRYEEDLKAGAPEGLQDLDLWVFMRAATWPDQVRDPKHPLNATHHHPTWHYVNFPYVPRAADRETVKPPEPDETEGKVVNILQALPYFEKQLRAAETKPDEKAVALCWLLHLIGDLHQPLHTTALFSAQFPQGDQGGNLFLVKCRGEPIRLHIFWDLVLGTSIAPQAVDLWAHETQARPACQRAALSKELERADYKAWALESFALAREVVYDGGRLQGALRAEVEKNPATPVPPLPLGYEETARLCAMQRVALAAYRLTDKIGEWYGKP